jgi:hypothetical protein
MNGIRGKRRRKKNGDKKRKIVAKKYTRKETEQ